MSILNQRLNQPMEAQVDQRPDPQKLVGSLSGYTVRPQIKGSTWIVYENVPQQDRYGTARTFWEFEDYKALSEWLKIGHDQF